MPYYLPKGVDPGVLRYWFPEDGHGLVNNDLAVLLRSSRNPVLAHLFMDHLLDPDVALANMSATGYQPPQNTLTAAKLVADEYIPQNLTSAAVVPGSFTTGFRTLELAPDVDARWQAVWQRFKAGA
jgi:spermidine/putrescine transport system substrate-binding protein